MYNPFKLIKEVTARTAVLVATCILLAFAPADKVYICISSGATKYHSHYCQGLKKCSHRVEEVSKAVAIQKGYGPCGYCY